MIIFLQIEIYGIITHDAAKRKNENYSIDIVWAKIQIAITAVGGWLGYFVGGMDGLLIALLVFVVLDYIVFTMNSEMEIKT